MRLKLLSIPLAGIAAIVAPAIGICSPNKTAARVSFLNDVIPALGRSGCNQGSCHGALVGKGGFRLSLRGYAPELDYQTMLRENGGRRVSLLAPEQSLILLKPGLKVAHMGGLALKPGTPEYEVVSRWLAQGAVGPESTDPHVVGLDVTPNSTKLLAPGKSDLKVIARFSDGTKRDVTYWAHYATNDDRIATVDKGGKVDIAAPGQTAITIAYQDKVAIARVLMPYPNSVDQAALAKLPASGMIDKHIYNKLAELKLWPSPITNDAQFCRRIYLDLTGTLPSPEQLTGFLKQKQPNRRNALVDQLLSSPDFTDYWTYRFGDLMRVNRGLLKDKGMWAFYAYLHDSIGSNRSWDKIATDVLTSSGNTFMDGPANYLRTAQTPQDLTENISQGFLGVRVGCARCHNHPLEKWTQNDYYGMANLFSRVGRKMDKDPRVHNEMTIFNMVDGNVDQPRLGKPLPPKPLGGPQLALASNDDRRAYFAKWLTAPDNYFFPRAIVNRVWAHLMGRGLVEDVDDLRETNPPTNQPLFDALAKDFVAHGYDLRYLMKQIVTSQAYQRVSAVNANNSQDDRYYSHYLVKRLAAEEILDSLVRVTGVDESFSGIPTGYRAIQLPDTQVKSEFLDSFGRPARQITCECERSQEPSMGQALIFINGDLVNRQVASDKGVVPRLMRKGKSDAEIVEYLYLSALGRQPNAEERTRSKNVLATNTAYSSVNYAWYRMPGTAPGWVEGKELKRRRALEDLLWALVNSKEFLFNH